MLEAPSPCLLDVLVIVVARDLRVHALETTERIDVGRPGSGLPVELRDDVVGVDVEHVLESRVGVAPEYLVDDGTPLGERKAGGRLVPDAVLGEEFGDRIELLGVTTERVQRTELLDRQAVFGRMSSMS